MLIILLGQVRFLVLQTKKQGSGCEFSSRGGNWSPDTLSPYWACPTYERMFNSAARHWQMGKLSPVERRDIWRLTGNIKNCVHMNEYELLKHLTQKT